MVETSPFIIQRFDLGIQSHPSLYSETQRLAKHSRRAYIKTVRLTAHGSLPSGGIRDDGTLMSTSDSVDVLFQLLQQLPRLECLELDLWYYQTMIVAALRDAPLLRPLQSIQFMSRDPIWHALGAEFWTYHSQNLRSVRLLAVTRGEDVVNSTHLVSQAYPLLEKLHIRDPFPARLISISPNLHSLIVEEIEGTQMTALCEALQYSALREDQTPVRVSSDKQGADLPRLPILTFDFGFSSINPLAAYTTLAQYMPTLRYLTARHHGFPSAGILREACAALHALPALEEFQWIMGSYGLIWPPRANLEHYDVISTRLVSQKDGLPQGDVSAMKAEFMIVPFLLGGCKSLRRVILRQMDTSLIHHAGNWEKETKRVVTFTRDSFDSAWVGA